MISKTTLIALMAVFAVVYSNNCDKCQKMIDNCRTQFNNDFTNVSADQLKSCMDTQCDKEFSGFEKSACKNEMSKDKNDLLKAYQSGETNQQICKQAVEHPCVPLNTPIYGGFNHDAKIEIHGEPIHGCHHGFTVEFPSAEGIALHMDVRLGKHGEHCVVLNNLRHVHWECEERHSNVFHCGHHFHMKIKNHHSHFSIHVNGCHFATFHHRESPHHIRELVIRGDVRVSRIHFEHFHGHNGGGVQVGSIGMGVAPMAPIGFGVSPAPPPLVVGPPPIMVGPPPIVAGPAPVVVVEEGRHHHHHHHHSLLHDLFHHHHHHCD